MSLSNQGKVLTLESEARQVEKLELKRSVHAAFGSDNKGNQ